MHSPVSIKIDNVFLEQLAALANGSVRKRAHRNLHTDLAAPVQRTCVALKKGTYIRPHLHPQKEKWKLLVVLRGTLGVLIFDEFGTVTERVVLSPGSGCSAMELAAQVWHTVFPLNGDAVILDIKEGPYDPVAEVCFAPWAPEENTEEAAAFLGRMERVQKGNTMSSAERI
jgi:cupin fold WbuC family metalloprotein